MKNRIIAMAIFVAAEASGGGYVPTPAPNPMNTFHLYPNQVFHGKFNIEDASGPEGMIIVCEPNILTITSSAITPIPDYNDARRYTYYFDYTAGEVSQTVIVKSFDSRNREVDNSIVFDVMEDALQVFTECNEVTEPVSMEWEVTWPVLWGLADNKICYQQMKLDNNNRVVVNNYSVME
jgi:hypothetical protein